MKTVIQFLRKLKENNNREWFMDHKQEYLDAQATFNAFVEKILIGLSEADESVRGLTVKDCTYRIYRDVRFSKDKSPYKTHMGAYICPGGKKSVFAGYYFHVGIGGHGYPDGHMLAVGDYICEPKVLKIIREDIQDDGDAFQAVIDKAHPVFVLDDSFKLKKVPQGFDKESPWADYLKYKVYCLWQEPTDKLYLADDAAQKVTDIFLSAKPFLEFINRAVAYVKEGNE